MSVWNPPYQPLDKLIAKGQHHETRHDGGFCPRIYAAREEVFFLDINFAPGYLGLRRKSCLKGALVWAPPRTPVEEAGQRVQHFLPSDERTP